MTNYEWLCKENKLEEFIEEISLSGEYILYGCYSEYKIDAKYGDWRKSVAEWLKAEHKANTTKWVRLDDVLMFVNAPIDIDPSKSFLGSDVIDKLETYQKYTSEQIRNTVIKEIEE